MISAIARASHIFGRSISFPADFTKTLPRSFDRYRRYHVLNNEISIHETQEISIHVAARVEAEKTHMTALRAGVSSWSKPFAAQSTASPTLSCREPGRSQVDPNRHRDYSTVSRNWTRSQSCDALSGGVWTAPLKWDPPPPLCRLGGGRSSSTRSMSSVASTNGRRSTAAAAAP